MPESIPGAIITFPMLGEGFALDPASTYTLFGRTFYWYGAIIGLGFLLGVLYTFLRGKKDFGVTPDDMTDVILVALPSAIIGARLYYVACHWSNYAADTVWATIWNICKIWEGGTAIPGGILLALVCLWFYCRRKKYSLGAVLDLCAFALLIGQCVGRWANFINREAFGFETEIFCRMGLTRGGETWYVHPLFLYESLWNLIGFLFLHFWSKRGGRRYDGQAFLIYMAWYGFGRFFLEMLRTEPLLFPGTNIMASQFISGIEFVACATLLINLGRRKHDPAALWVNRRAAAKSETEPDDTSASGSDGNVPT